MRIIIIINFMATDRVQRVPSREGAEKIVFHQTLYNISHIVDSAWVFDFI